MLSVVVKGTRADELLTCLKKSCLSCNITPVLLIVKLRERLGGNQNAQEFSDLLLQTGEGTLPARRKIHVIR